MDDDNGDGFDPVAQAQKDAFEGAHLNLKDMKRPDGILTKGLSDAQSGVLQRSMTAIDKDEDYRQELKTSFLLSTEEADRVSGAINEALRYGCSLKPIVDWVIARSAGVNGGRLRAIFETISSTTFTTNYQGTNKKRWWSNDKSGSGSGSRLDQN